jgi:hypothetical protein
LAEKEIHAWNRVRDSNDEGKATSALAGSNTSVRRGLCGFTSCAVNARPVAGCFAVPPPLARFGARCCVGGAIAAYKLIGRYFRQRRARGGNRRPAVGGEAASA